MLSTNYSYSELKGASGSVNVIAVVKYHRSPVKTRGSGYSLFVSLTDPSLQGAKLPCIFFNDDLEKLPPIRSIGDIIVTHRLIVKEFHGELHGYGYGTMGFAAVVFSGLPTEPLEPRHSSTTCSFGTPELRRVQELREWYNAPDCPVERELDAKENEPTAFTSFSHPADTPSDQDSTFTITRLWQLKPRRFVSVEGQVVGTYRYPDEDRCTIMYLWDGPSYHDSSNRTSTFVGPPKDHITRLLQSVNLEPRLAAITAHRLPNEGDWSVPVFLYDEHSICHAVKPGDIVRVRNVHVTKCPSVSEII